MTPWGPRAEAPQRKVWELLCTNHLSIGNPHQSPRKSLSLSPLYIWGNSGSGWLNNVARLGMGLSCEERQGQVHLCSTMLPSRCQQPGEPHHCMPTESPTLPSHTHSDMAGREHSCLSGQCRPWYSQNGLKTRGKANEFTPWLATIAS